MISADDRASLVGRNSPQIRELPFASCYVYSPSDARGAARLLRASVKAGRVNMLVDRALQVDAEARRPQSLTRFFSDTAILVPVPGSNPSSWGGATASGRVAVALWKHGLGKGVWFGLRRIRAVRKSSTAAPGARPSVQAHFDTMVVEPADISGVSHVVLVDDVVTKGRTLLAASLRLREVLPEADVRGFALLRTMGYSPVLDRFLMPCMGKILWTRDDARRSP
jgi:hypothetical protein